MSRSMTLAQNGASACTATLRLPKISSGYRPANSSRPVTISARRLQRAKRAAAAPDAAAAASRSPERAGLAQRFVHYDRHCVGEIQAAHAWLEDWNPIRAVASLRQEVAAESGSLAAEEQEIASLVVCVEIGRGGVGREKF